MNSKSIFRNLFHRFLSKEQAPPKPSDPLALAYAEIAELRETVFDLLVEVEAIREALLRSPVGSAGSRSTYAIAYRDTALLTHDSTGPSGGHDKLMARFYSGAPEHLDWRECLFLSRVGFSEDEIAKYKDKAEEAETYT